MGLTATPRGVYKAENLPKGIQIITIDLREGIFMRMIKFGLVAIAFTMLVSGCGDSGISSGDVLVIVNGEEITDGDLKFLGEINPRIQRQLGDPKGKKRILDNLVEQDLLYQKAVKQGINRDPEVKAKANLYRRVIIAQALVEDEIDKAAKAYYEENQDEFKKLRLAHITVKFGDKGKDKKGKGKKGKGITEEEALKKAGELKAKIDSGASFEEVTKESSDDAMTKNRGGNLGLVDKNDKRLIARGFQPVLEKAFEIKVGEVAGPIKTTNGYEIITVTRGIELEPFEEAKQSILFKVRGDARQKLIAELKEDAKIVYPGEEKKAEAEAAAAAAEKPAVEATPEAKPDAKTAPETLPAAEAKTAPETVPAVEAKPAAEAEKAKKAE